MRTRRAFTAILAAAIALPGATRGASRVYLLLLAGSGCKLRRLAEDITDDKGEL